MASEEEKKAADENSEKNKKAYLAQRTRKTER